MFGFERSSRARTVAPLAFGAISAAASLALLPLAPNPARAYEMIENHEDRPDPWIINGCKIGPKAECPNADLRFSDLRGANLSGSNLANAKFDRSDLRYADLRGAKLAGADFGGADLRNIFMQGIKAPHASFVGANLENARIGGSDLSGADFTVANLEMTQARRAKFNGAKFVNTDMQEAKFQETDLTNAFMDGPLLRFVNLEDAWMQGCKGCPMHWQTDRPVWEEYPLQTAPQYPDAPSAAAKSP